MARRGMAGCGAGVGGWGWGGGGGVEGKGSVWNGVFSPACFSHDNYTHAQPLIAGYSFKDAFAIWLNKVGGGRREGGRG